MAGYQRSLDPQVLHLQFIREKMSIATRCRSTYLRDEALSRRREIEDRPTERFTGMSAAVLAPMMKASDVGKSGRQ